MHVTACLAGQKVDVEVGEDCCSLQALREAIVKELPQLCVEGFDVSVGGRALDDDEGVVSLEEATCLDVSANARGLSVLALREAGREVSEAGVFRAAINGDVALVALYLDAGVPADCVDADPDSESDHPDYYPPRHTPLHLACNSRDLPLATLLLDRGSNVIDKKDEEGCTPLHLACRTGNLSLVTLLLDRGSDAIDEKADGAGSPLHIACGGGDLPLATLLIDRGSAIDKKGCNDNTPLHFSCFDQDTNKCLALVTLLLDRGSSAIDEKNIHGYTPLHFSCLRNKPALTTLLLDRGSAIDETDGMDHTALHLSLDRAYWSPATVLLKRGCSFDAEARSLATAKWDPCPQEVLELLAVPRDELIRLNHKYAARASDEMQDRRADRLRPRSTCASGRRRRLARRLGLQDVVNKTSCATAFYMRWGRHSDDSAESVKRRRVGEPTD